MILVDIREYLVTYIVTLDDLLRSSNILTFCERPAMKQKLLPYFIRCLHFSQVPQLSLSLALSLYPLIIISKSKPSKKNFSDDKFILIVLFHHGRG